MPLRVIFVDLNSYFASVEQAERPELIGHPIAVVPVVADTTSCLAASYPAKAYGIKTGTSVREARRLCPQITFIEADHRKYVHYHHRILQAIERCFPVWKVFSIDEMAIRLYGREQEPEFARNKALEIKRRIIEEVHPALTCSIGIAPNRYLAKIASDMQKPDGLTIIHSEELPDRLYDLKLRDFPGIGPRMEQRLKRAHCTTAWILCQKTPEELSRLWGSKAGRDFWLLIRGEELEERETRRGSIGHSRVLSPRSRTPDRAWSHLVALISKAGMRLRQERYYARTMHLQLRFLSGSSDDGSDRWVAHSRFPETQDTDRLLEELTRLWARAPKNHLLQIALSLGGLNPAEHHQISLFDDLRRERLMAAVDRLNKDHRKNLVVVGDSVEVGREMRSAIAFGYIPGEGE